MAIDDELILIEEANSRRRFDEEREREAERLRIDLEAKVNAERNAIEKAEIEASEKAQAESRDAGELLIKELESKEEAVRKAKESAEQKLLTEARELVEREKRCETQGETRFGADTESVQAEEQLRIQLDAKRVEGQVDLLVKENVYDEVHAQIDRVGRKNAEEILKSENAAQNLVE